MNINKVFGLLDLHVDVIIEVFREPSLTIVLLVLPKACGVDLRRHLGELEVEVDVAGVFQLSGFLKCVSLFFEVT